MKIYLFLISALIGVSFSTFGTGFSKLETTNGIYLAIESWRPGYPGPITQEPFVCSDKLTFSGFCNTGKVELQYPADTAYFIRMTMMSQDGQEIPKTSLGKTFGSKFDELHVLESPHVGILLAGGSYEDNKGEGMAKPLPSPLQLFKIKKPGVYFMEIQIQMFLLQTNANPWTRELIHFSPIKIRVEKPPDE